VNVPPEGVIIGVATFGGRVVGAVVGFGLPPI